MSCFKYELVREGCITGLTLFTAFVMVATCRGFPVFQLPQLQEASSDIKITEEQASWIATLTILPNPVGSIFGGILMDLIGRKLTLQLIFIPFAVAWAIIGFSHSVEMIYFGTFINGIATGACYCSSTYIAEICTAEHRGPLLGFLEPTFTFGILLCNLLVHNLGWRTCAFCFVCSSIICSILLFLLPESPSWLITQGKTEKALKILTWLRGNPGEAEREMVEIENSLELTLSKKRSNGGDECDPLRKVIDMSYDVCKSWKPLAILTGLVTLQRMCGCPILESYTVIFFSSLQLPFDSRKAAIYHSSANFAASFFTPFAVQKLPRRMLLCITSLIMAICMFVVHVYELNYYVDEKFLPFSSSIKASSSSSPSILSSEEQQPHFYIVLVSIYIYDIASTLGVLPLPFILSGELFPTENRGMMNGIYGCFSFLICSAVVKTFPTFLSFFGIINVVLIYAIVCLVIVFYGKFLLPETRGKTLLEIQVKYFKKHGEHFVENIQTK